MPTHSREVLTLRLIVDCQLDLIPKHQRLEHPNGSIPTPSSIFPYPSSRSQQNQVEDCHEYISQPRDPASLLSLPTEVRLKILRYILLFDYNVQIHTRRLPQDSIQHLLSLDSRRILEAPQFKHKGKQEINGILPTFTSCTVDPSILRVCRVLYLDGCSVLYGANLVVAVHCGIRGLGAKFRNYGVKVWGPLPPSRVIGTTGSALAKSSTSLTAQADAFKPLITFRGQNSKPDTPVYICSQKTLTHLIHALWILVKCSFARGMKFSVHASPTGRPKHRISMDAILRFALLPWMHNHIDKISGTELAQDDVATWMTCLETHRAGSHADPNVYTYNAVCAYLESLMSSAEKAIESGQFTRAETLHELVCYEACSIVRTRTGKLVDVSTKTKEGINRVCKLIAISAFRLCELRSGAIVKFKAFRNCTCIKPAKEPPKEVPSDPAEFIALTKRPIKTACPVHTPEAIYPLPGRQIKTTRLDAEEATNHAILSALLALRLPCATPVPEWNIRLNQMLLYLFNLKHDRENTKACIRRLHSTCSALCKDANAKNKSGGKWTDLEHLVKDLKDNMEKDVKGTKNRKERYQAIVEDIQNVARKLWGERLTPKKGYIGLIWTFRWA